MKILHTSDWHLGQTFYSYDRTEEHIHFFNQLKDILRWEIPDAMLVSGDIFDVSNPSSSVWRLFKDTILDIHSLVPEMKIIVTAGNHDSASRIDIDRNLWKSGGIHVIGGLDRKDGEFDFGENIINIDGKGYVIALPFINRFALSKGKKESEGEYDFFKKIESLVTDKNVENLPVVLMAHLTIADCDMQGHREKTLGGIDSVKSDVFGNGFDYVALGHIHKAQQFENGRVAYSGAPVAISFDETGRHTVSVVNIKKGFLPEIENIEIKPLRELRTIPEEGVPFKKALRAIDRLPDLDLSYVRLNVAQKEDLPADCMEQAVARAKGKNCRFCTIKYVQSVERVLESNSLDVKAFEFVEMNPVEVADSFFRVTGVDPELKKEYLEILSKLHQDLKNEE